MEVLYARCAGLDVHKETVVACARVVVDGQIQQEVETFQLLMNLLIMPLFFLSNALFPMNQMPGWLHTLSQLNPISYAVDGLRLLLIGQGSFPLIVDAAVVGVSLLASLGLASYLFSKTSI